ncbi:MAG: M48 family metallopeptidase [Phycisphaerae bacterium]|nr:M48 family metallopeptidase [Phycisphaerae bacterium]
MQMLILASIAVALIGSAMAPDWPTGRSPLAPGLYTLATTLAAAVLLVAFNRLVVRRIDRTGQLDRRRYRRRMNSLGWSMLVLFAVQVFAFHWPVVPARALHLEGVPVLAELSAWLPFAAMLFAFWTAAYPVDARLRLLDLRRRIEASLPVYPAGADRPVWSLGQFLEFQVRFHLLLILLPVIALLAVKSLVTCGVDWIGPRLVETRRDLTDAEREGLLSVLLLASALGVLVLCPPMMTRVFSTRPLPPGRLLDNLHAAIARLGTRVRRILLWDTHGMVSNAAVMGPWGRLRYVMLSDGLLETLADEQIEGVFGHELGHVVHHHIIYYILLILSLTGWGSLLYYFAATLPAVRGVVRQHDWLRMPIAGALTVLLTTGGAIAFGWISRRFEWQADLTGAQSIELGGLADSAFLPAGAPTGEPFSVDQPPSAGAAEVYVSALFRIADVNGLDREQKTWRHGSIADRGRRLQRLCDPAQFRRFNATIRAIKWTILVAALGMLAMTVLSW